MARYVVAIGVNGLFLVELCRIRNIDGGGQKSLRCWCHDVVLLIVLSGRNCLWSDDC